MCRYLSSSACVHVWLQSLISLLAPQHPEYEKLLPEPERLLSKSTHRGTSTSSYRPGSDLENPFLASVRGLSLWIMNASASTQEICVTTCMLSSFPHALSNRRLFGDSTMINALPSIFQSCGLFTSQCEFLFNLPTSLPTIYMFTIYITYPSVSMHIFSSIFDLVSLLIYSFLLVFSVKRCTHNSTAFARNVLNQAAAQRCNSNAQNFSLNTWLRWTAHP